MAHLLAVLFRLFLLGAIAFAITSFVTAPATAHNQTLNSVDTSTNPPEIRYTTSSKYTGAVSNAISRWNGEPGGVAIRADTSSTVNDLEIFDQHSSDTWHGRWVWNPAADNLNFNTRILDGSTWNGDHRRKTALHEFGHAHGLGHNSLAWPQSIMRQGKRAQTTLGSHDKSDYANKW